MIAMVPAPVSVAVLAATTGVGLIFLEAGLTKLKHRAILPGVVANYRVIPAGLVGAASAMLPWVEIAVGAALIVGITPVPVVLAIGLLWLFAAAMGINLVRGRSAISCGCGSPNLSQSLGWHLVARNLVFTVPLFARLAPSPPLSAIDIATALAAGIGAWLAFKLFTSIGALGVSPVLPSRR